MTLFLIVASLATARAVRLLVNDTIIDKPRNWLLPRLPEYLRKLLGCPWCLSAWISAGVTIWYWVAHTLAMPLLAFGAIWWGACASYFLTELLAFWRDPPDPASDTATTVNNFWANKSEELPERPPLPGKKRRRN